ncbi:MAG: hypothetical protein M3540_00180 [Actinomycetota bacterium]|nr:hypothetical protein [Actinomycetota bacterium]
MGRLNGWQRIAGLGCLCATFIALLLTLFWGYSRISAADQTTFAHWLNDHVWNIIAPLLTGAGAYFLGRLNGTKVGKKEGLVIAHEAAKEPESATDAIAVAAERLNMPIETG